MRIEYQSFKFKPETLALIAKANEIITDYRKQGYQLTLRQLYYQFVSRDLIANKQSEYNRLGSVINDARLAGMIDWEAIVDLTRELTQNSHWDSPRDIVRACARQYQLDKWDSQPYHVEVWIEKDALSGVIEPVCKSLDVPFFSCRGYTSQSAMWNAGRRLMDHRDRGQELVIIHLGDHDPSGIDMTRDIGDRLAVFSEGEVLIRRIALNFDQVQLYNPPPNPAKITDSRATAYMARHGRMSWELDALEPRVLTALIRDSVGDYLDPEAFAVAKEREESHRAAIAALVDQLPSGDDDE